MNEDNKLARWLDGRMDESELREFQASAEYNTYKKIADFSAQLKAPDMNMNATYASIVAKRDKANKEPKTIRLQPWLGRIAAVLVIALGLTFFMYTNRTTTQVADAGKRTEFLLPDNSRVVLNAGSEASFKEWNWNKNRNLDLTGEAYFKVAKGQTFDVNTPLGKVTVVGTQFNVKARNDRFDVTCFEGKVKVTYRGKELLLTPGMSIAFENGNDLKVPEVNAQQPGWITYETTFVKENLQNVTEELERQYNIDFDVKNVASTAPFSGTLPTNDLETALGSITSTYHLKAIKTGKTIVLSSE